MILQKSLLTQEPEWCVGAAGRPQFWNGNDFASNELDLAWTKAIAVVTTILMVIGADTVRSALAQATGKGFSPVCFSFGWAGYALSCLLDVFGDGRLLPPPDYPVKVFNLTSGYQRTNRSWVIGRISRDHEYRVSSQEPLKNNSIRITVYEAEDNPNGMTQFSWNALHTSGVCITILQLVIAALPTILTGGSEWDVLLVTVSGTLLAMLMGSLRQWTAEKLPFKQNCRSVFALTAGNGTRDIMIIKGKGNCLDLEEMATLDLPRNGRLWAKFEYSNLGREIFGMPKGHLTTCVWVIVQAVFWLYLLVFIARTEGHTLFLLLNGAIGFVYNSIIATLKRNPKHRNLPLTLIDTIATRKTMDGLMDLEITHQDCGARTLVDEFFPGKWRDEEYEWWNTTGDRSVTKYDQQRLKEYAERLLPRSMIPKYALHTATTKDSKGKSRLRATREDHQMRHQAGISYSGIHGGVIGDRPPLVLADRPGETSTSAVRPSYEDSETSDHNLGHQSSLSPPNSSSPLIEFAKSFPRQPDWD
ncbi:hypothetical protein F4805DRAFT_452232 [Annulohypoxylon moriforme]|nr:hypothetical protein F4805DRAFT_452232 [Annulohypoxylon moriforme]